MKNIMFLVFGALILLTLQSCQSDTSERAENDSEQVNTQQKTPAKMIEQLVGEWSMDSVARGGSAAEADTEDQTLTFTSEARYILRSGNEKVDSGAYRMNEQLRNLYLESEINETPKEYELELKQDTLVLSLKQDTHQRANVKYIYTRRE